MRRTYTAAGYLKLMDTARRHVPHACLAGDMIVGFCGETQADFQATVDLVRRVQYGALFVFKYSPRPGTAAERNMDDDVPHDVKAGRNNGLLAVQAEISRRHREQFVGCAVDVLVEGFSKRSRGHNETCDGQEATKRRSGEATKTEAAAHDIRDSVIQPSQQDRGQEAVRPSPNASGRNQGRRQLVGRTPGDLIVVFDGDESHIGSMARVRIEQVTPYTMLGRLEQVVSAPRRSRPTTRLGRALPVLEAK
jgi:tRNA A37 methylthiotransferase MiaB